VLQPTGSTRLCAGVLRARRACPHDVKILCRVAPMIVPIPHVHLDLGSKLRLGVHAHVLVVPGAVYSLERLANAAGTAARYAAGIKSSLYEMYTGMNMLIADRVRLAPRFRTTTFSVAGSMPLNTSLSRVTICCGIMSAIFPFVHGWETPL
jgi:hypothetical protein